VTAVDAMTVLAVAAIVLMLLVPQARVRGLLSSEDEVIVVLADLDKLEEAHRTSGKTDRDKNGVGEYAPLGDVLGARAPEFERVEGTDIWRRRGYYYTVLVPDSEYMPVPATDPRAPPAYAEVAKLIVAWPADPGRTGMRAYARWPGGVLLQHGIDGFPYGEDPPFPRVALVRRDAKGPHPVEKYDRKDWAPPVFSTQTRPRAEQRK
jgi:hypothetical protein